MSELLIEHNPAPMKLEVLGVDHWPVSTHDISTFKSTYEQTVTCFVIEGRAVITPDDDPPAKVEGGDLVIFLPGLSCTWEVKQPMRLHCQTGS